MPINTTAQGNIKISDINTENTSTTSNSLKTLSDTAASGTDPADGAPYGMGEFRGYSHGPSDHNVTISWGTPQGKIGFRGGTASAGAAVPFGSQHLSSASYSENINVLSYRHSKNSQKQVIG